MTDSVSPLPHKHTQTPYLFGAVEVEAAALQHRVALHEAARVEGLVELGPQHAAEAALADFLHAPTHTNTHTMATR